MPWFFRVSLFCVLASSGVCGAPVSVIACADYYANLYHVPRELVHAVIEVESAWHPYAVSSKGAAGLMQLMPATAVAFGVQNRFRIEQNIAGGVAYLALLLRRFGGDLRLVVAAYYTGEARVARRGLRFSSPDVYAYVRRVAMVYRRLRIESLMTR